jgi:branched-chain amino acid transport system substrate-binding protein
LATLFAAGVLATACSGAGADTTVSDPPASAVHDVAPVDTAGPADGTDTASTVPSAPESTVPSTTVPGVFADDNATELAVGILVSWTGFGQVPSSPISVAAATASQDIAVGSPLFEFGAPFVLTDDSDLTDDPAQLRESFRDLLDGTVDLVIGPLPASHMADFTEIAEGASTPFVVPNYVDDGSVPSDVRLDIGGSVDAHVDVLVAEVVAGEYPGIVVVGASTDPNLRLVAERLVDVGAAPIVATLPGRDSTPDDLAAALAVIETIGDGAAVVLVSPGAAAVVAAALAGSDVALFAGDLSLSRTEVAALDGLNRDQLVVVRRVDDLRRPEQADFANRLAEFDNGLEATLFSAESYDAYALAALAAAQIGRAETSTLASGMIEASRTGEPCTELDVCLALIANGIDIDYEGWSGPIEFDDGGIARATWFGVQVVDPSTGGVESERFVLSST